MSGKAAILIFPGTNSEDETLRMLHAVGVDAYLVHWSRGETLPEYDAYVLPGGFAYEDRIRAGAIPAHDRMMDHVIDGAQRGKLVLGICNGAQILLEAGLVPGTGEVRRPTAAFTRNAQRHFVSKHVQVRLAVDPSRSPFTAHLEKNLGNLPERKLPNRTPAGEYTLTLRKSGKPPCQPCLTRFCFIHDPPWLPGQRIAPRPD